MKRMGLGFSHPDTRQDRVNRDVVAAVNEIAGIEIEVTTGPADVRFSLVHRELGHPPREAHVLLATVPGNLYAADMTLWTPEVSFWKYTGANARLSVRLR
jgi:hypothetical protein